MQPRQQVHPASGKLDHVDAIRGMAVLWVILVHTSQRLTELSPAAGLLAEYSQMGVQLFFIASAYTLCLAWHRRRDEASPLLSFYIRRFLRIAPLYWIAIGLYGAIHLAKQVARGGSVSLTEPFTPANVATNAGFVHGFVPEANNVVVPGGWSIGTEMAFYLVFPLLFALLLRTPRRAAALWIGFLAAVIVNLVVQRQLAPEGRLENNSFMYFNLLNQLPVFLLGMACFQHERPVQPDSRPTLWPWAGFAAATAAALFIWWRDPPWAFAMLPTVAGVSFCFLLFAFRQMHWRRDALLCRIGRASYSMYIFHFLFAWFVWGAIAPRLPGWLPGELKLAAAFPVVMGLTYLVARVTERWIEQPGIRAGSRLVARLQQRTSRAAAGAGVGTPML